MRIKSVHARQIINSKGYPALEVEVATERYSASSSAPIAASKSKYEFYDSFDNDLQKFNGQTLDIAAENINRVVAPELLGKRSMDQEDLDSLILQIDNSHDRKRLGVSTITALSQAIAKLGALESNLPLFKYIRVLHDFSELNHSRLNSDYELPIPVITAYRSSSHDRAERLPLQELMLLPKTRFSYVTDLIPMFEGLNSIRIDSTDHTLKSFLSHVEKSLKSSKFKFSLGLDLTASQYKREDHSHYILPSLHSKKTSFKGNFSKLLDQYLSLINNYDLAFLEDLFDEDEYSGWNELLDKAIKVNKKVQIVSDDFTATNMERLEKIALLEAANNVVIKPSQAGTISEVIHFASRARKYGLNLTVSYRFGETEDTFVSDLAVGIGADYIRTGYFKGSEHNSKLNRLVQIEQSL